MSDHELEDLLRELTATPGGQLSVTVLDGSGSFTVPAGAIRSYSRGNLVVVLWKEPDRR